MDQAKQAELLIRLDERVEAMSKDMEDVKKRLTSIEKTVAEDKNKKMGMYTVLIVLGGFVSWLVQNLYTIKTWIIP